MSPKWAYFVLTPDVPDGQTHFLVLNSFDIEACFNQVSSFHWGCITYQQLEWYALQSQFYLGTGNGTCLPKLELITNKLSTFTKKVMKYRIVDFPAASSPTITIRVSVWDLAYVVKELSRTHFAETKLDDQF